MAAVSSIELPAIWQVSLWYVVLWLTNDGFTIHYWASSHEAGKYCDLWFDGSQLMAVQFSIEPPAMWQGANMICAVMVDSCTILFWPDVCTVQYWASSHVAGTTVILSGGSGWSGLRLKIGTYKYSQERCIRLWYSVLQCSAVHWMGWFSLK